jgi:hypothetical protein
MRTSQSSRERTRLRAGSHRGLADRDSETCYRLLDSGTVAIKRRAFAFTPFASLTGGALIGLAASLLLLGDGRIAGISGIARHYVQVDEPGEVARQVLTAGGQ